MRLGRKAPGADSSNGNSELGAGSTGLRGLPFGFDFAVADGFALADCFALAVRFVVAAGFALPDGLPGCFDAIAMSPHCLRLTRKKTN